MDKSLTLDMTPEEASQLGAMIEQCLKAIREANDRMDRDEAARVRLKAETRVLLDQIKTVLHVEANL